MVNLCDLKKIVWMIIIGNSYCLLKSLFFFFFFFFFFSLSLSLSLSLFL